MTFQAYLDTILAKTGMRPEDFRAAAEAKGLYGPDVKASQIAAWLKDEFGLGPGHSMAVFSILKEDFAPRMSVEERIAVQFAGAKAVWLEPYETLLATLKGFGPDVAVGSTDTYISLLRGEKKFGVIAVAAKRFDVGIKLKGVEPTERLAPGGNWNSMVTHRVQVTDPAGLDQELVGWLRDAYDRAA